MKVIKERKILKKRQINVKSKERNTLYKHQRLINFHNKKRKRITIVNKKNLLKKKQKLRNVRDIVQVKKRKRTNIHTYICYLNNIVVEIG